MEYIELEHAENIFNVAKRLLASKKKQKKLIEKDTSEMTQKSIGNHRANVTWQNMEIAKLIFEMHTEIVQANICKPNEDEWYGDELFRPSAFHGYTFKRPHPLKGKKNE